MRVEQQSLIPTKQHTEAADLSTEMATVACDHQQCLCTSAKQQVEDCIVGDLH